MKTRKKLLGTALALSLGAILMYPVPASAAEGTDGTEMQVMQPEQLEIQLGADWTGVEFELKTDAGIYPGTIPVGEDGVLRLEIGGSSSYILTCMNSAVSVPEPEQAPAATEEPQEEISDSNGGSEETETGGSQDVGQVTEDDPGADQETGTSPAEETNGNTVAGIPVTHLVLFIGGLVLAIGSLVVMYAMKRHRETAVDYEEEDEDE